MKPGATEKPPDWQLPPGVDGGLWDYLHSREVAHGYEASLGGSSLFTLDIAFVREQAPQPCRLVDLGCGTGRLLRELAPLGYTLTGIDLSPEMLAEARRLNEGLPVEWRAGNLTQLTGIADASFEVAACLFSTLGMIRGAENRRRALAEAYRIVRPGGLLVLHVHNRWWRLHDAAGRSWLWSDLLGWRDADLEPGDHRMPTHQGVAGLVLHLFTRGEIVRLVREAGFRLREVRPVSLAPNGRLSLGGWLADWRAYGYLLAAEKA